MWYASAKKLVCRFKKNSKCFHKKNLLGKQVRKSESFSKMRNSKGICCCAADKLESESDTSHRVFL